MWTRKTLERYEQNIPQEAVRNQFRKLIRALPWQGKTGFETCSDAEVASLAQKMNIENLIRDLTSRIREFIDKSSDVSASPSSAGVRSRKTTLPF